MARTTTIIYFFCHYISLSSVAVLLTCKLPGFIDYCFYSFYGALTSLYLLLVATSRQKNALRCILFPFHALGKYIVIASGNDDEVQLCKRKQKPFVYTQSSLFVLLYEYRERVTTHCTCEDVQVASLEWARM